jgi:hypothetical protein
MSSSGAFTCYGCDGTFAGFGISVGSVDASLGEPGDATAGEFCDRCVATWQPATSCSTDLTNQSDDETTED